MSVLATSRPVREPVKNQWECSRCGRTLLMQKHKSGMCGDCRRVDAPKRDRSRITVATVVGGEHVTCESWNGEYDDDDRPVKKGGELVLPGRRICGHSDCVNWRHVEGAPPPFNAERPAEVIESIRELRAAGVPAVEIASRFGYSETSVRSIVAGRTYAAGASV